MTLRACMTKAMKQWEFPRHEGGDMDVERSFDFGGAVDKEPAPHQRKVNIDLHEADIANVVRLIGDVGGKNLVFSDEDVTGKVTMKFVDTPWDQALDAVLATRGLVVEDRDGTLFVSKPKAAK